MSKEDIVTLIESASEVNPLQPDMSVLKLARKKPPIFPKEIFGEYISSWLSDAAESTGAPIDYVAGTLLAAIAALIGNARRVSPWQGWEEPSILWVGLVGDPSSGKSPGMDPVLNLMRTVESDMSEGFEEELREWETNKTAAHYHKQAWESAVEKAVKGGEVAPIMPEEAVEPPELHRKRVMVTDTSIEKMAVLASVNPKGMLLHRDELAGFIGSFDRYGGKGVDRAFWLESYGGRQYVVDRVKHLLPITIPHLLIGVIGGIQPDRMAPLISNADDGLAARFLWVWPERVPPRRPTKALDKTIMLGALGKISSLALDFSGNGEHQPRVKLLTEEASSCFEEWRLTHYKEAEEVSGILASHYGKAEGHILRLSLTLEFLWWSLSSESQEPEYISKNAVIAACELLESYFKPMAGRVFGDAAIPESERLTNTLARHIYKTKPNLVNVRQIRREAHLPGLRTPEAVNTAIEGLQEANWLFSLKEPNTHGRPRKDYKVNPRIWEENTTNT